MKFGMQLRYGNTSGRFKEFFEILIFFSFLLFFQKNDRNNFWFRLPSTLLVVAQWNLVCSFVMVIPRDISKDFSKFWFFFISAVFPKKYNFWFRLPSKLLVVPQWNLVCSFVMVIPRDILKDIWKFWIFLILLFSQKTDRNNFWFRLPSKLLVVPQWNLVYSFVMVIPRDIFKDFWKFWFFWVLLFSQKTDRNIFLFRLPSKLLVVPQWNLVCRFVMVIPRDTFKDFWNLCIFLIFAVFPKKQIEIFGPAYYLNDLSQLYETWCAALLWQYLGIFSRIFQKKIIFFCCFSKNR